MRRATWGKFLAICCVTIVLLGGFVLAIHYTSSESATITSPAARVESMSAAYSLVNGVDAITVNTTAATPGAMVVYAFSAPNSTEAPLITRNATEGELVTVNLSALPRLFVIHAYVNEANAPVYAKWAWVGRANVLIADTPGELAQLMREVSQ